jgi:hypothetical protein
MIGCYRKPSSRLEESRVRLRVRPWQILMRQGMTPPRAQGTAYTSTTVMPIGSA